MTALRKLLSVARHPSAIVRHAKGKRRIRKVARAPLEALLPCPSGQTPVFVSLTSYGDRLQTVHLAIKSIMLQTVRPNKVILYLDEESDGVELPAALMELQSYGLDIRRGYKNLKCHTKYLYAMSEHPDVDIITVDDDALYAPDVVESLVCAKAQHPDCVLARRVHRIAISDGIVAPYEKWEWEWSEPSPIPRSSLLATGVGGVLYPAGIVSPAALDVDLLERLALEADDLWLKVVEAIMGVKVVWAPNTCMHPYLIKGSQEKALSYENVAGKRNDAIWSALMEHFSLTCAAFVDGPGE